MLFSWSVAPVVAWPGESVAPDRVTPVYGRVTAGSVAQLRLEDGACLRVSRYTVPNLPVDPVTFRVEATLPSLPAAMSLRLVSRSAQMGAFTQSLNLYDWTKSVFEPMTNVTTPLLTGFAVSVCPTVGAVDRYVRPGDNRVWALVRVRPVGPTFVQVWSAEFDAASFDIEIGP